MSVSSISLYRSSIYFRTSTAMVLKGKGPVGTGILSSTISSNAGLLGLKQDKSSGDFCKTWYASKMIVFARSVASSMRYQWL